MLRASWLAHLWPLIVAACGPSAGEPLDAASAGSDAPPPVAIERRLTTTADPSAPIQNLTQWNFSHSVATDELGGVHAVYTELATNGIEYPSDVADPVDVAALPRGRVFYRRSLDGGETWADAVALADVAPGTDSANVAAQGDAVHAVWRATDGDRSSVFYRRSADRGATWSAPIVLSDSPAGVSVSPPSLSAASEGSSVFVVWADARPRTVGASTFSVREVYLAASDDGGLTWAPVVPVSTAEGRSSWTPSVAAVGSTVHVAWTDERDDVGECTRDGTPCREEEYYRRSLDGGASWDDEVRLTADPAESWAPSIAASGAAVHVVYLDRRTGAFRNYHRRSIDGGATWEAERLLPAAPEFANAARPTVAVGGEEVLLAWFGFTDFEADVYYARSSDGGLGWSPSVDLTAATPGAARLPHVAIDADGVGHVIWYDTRHSDAAGPRIEVYYARTGG